MIPPAFIEDLRKTVPATLCLVVVEGNTSFTAFVGATYQPRSDGGILHISVFNSKVKRFRGDKVMRQYVSTAKNRILYNEI